MSWGLTTIDGRIEIGGADPVESAVILSLFADARVTDEERPADEASRRGFWGDALTGSQTGSKLWLLAREKQTTETLRSVEDYARQALTWLVDDRIVDRIGVIARYDESRRLVLTITVGSRSFEFGDVNAL